MNNIKLIIYDFDSTLTIEGLGYHPPQEKISKFFGDDDRIQKIKSHFNFIKEKNIPLVILTFNNKDIVLHALKFMEIDQLVEVQDSKWMQKTKIEHKGGAVQFLISYYHSNQRTTLFIDDSETNVKSAAAQCVACKCQAVGVTINQFELIEKRITNEYDNTKLLKEFI